MRVILTTLALFAALVFNTLSFTVTANAADFYGYAYVDEGVTAYFCNEPDEHKSLFAIPETYCVTVIGEYNEKWYNVRYAEDDGVYIALYGYVQKSDLVLIDQPLENMYLHMPVKLIYKAETVEGMTALPPIEETAAFYGVYTIGGTECSYVYFNGSFGYYPATYPYALNTLPAAPTFSETSDDYDPKTVTAIVITVIAAAAVVILWFSGKHKPARKG